MRWIVERFYSWMDRCKSLAKNFDRTLDNANARIHLCFIRNMHIAVCKKVRTRSKMEKELKVKKWEQHIQKI